MTIKYKIMGVFVAVMLISAGSVIFSGHSIMQEAILKTYETKAKSNASHTLDFVLQNMLDTSSNYIQFLANDSNLVQTAYYAIKLDSTHYLQELLPELRTRLKLSFIEIMNLKGHIVYTTIKNGNKPMFIQEQDSGRDEHPHDHTPRFEFDKTSGQFIVHAGAYIIRKGQKIGIIHGGYILDRQQLKRLATDISIGFYDDNAELSASSADFSPDKVAIKKLYNSIAFACQSDPLGDRCNRTRFAVHRKIIDGINYLMVATPIRVANKKPIGVMVLSQDASDLAEDLTHARIITVLISLTGIVTAILLGYFLARSLSLPIIRLKDAALQLGQGKLDTRVNVKSNDELGVLAEAFNDMGDSIQLADRTKSEFLANMSHEIRTPLNGVLGMLHLMGKTQLDNNQKRFLETATGSSELLLTVINDILDFSKIEAGRLELESIPFNPTDLIEETVALMANGAHDKGVELISSAHCNLPILVRGDPTRLRQVLSNLVSNAIKFTDKGHVVLYAIPAEERILFGVVDTGIGMDEQQQQAVLMPFTQADSSHTRKYGGTGLGLTISNRLIEAMGGKLRLASAPGFGSDFSFEIPLMTVDEQFFNERCSQLLPQQHILVVDDNDTNLEVIKHLLSSWGVQNISLATDSNDALQQLRQASKTDNPFDIVILDMQMPGMTGLELAHIIRTDPQLEKLHLAMLSSVDRHEPTPELDVWLTKPVRQSELYNSLLIMLGEQSQKELAIPAAPEKTDDWWFEGKLILLVEDNLINQEVAREILSDVGLSIDTCENGQEAIRMVQENTYDLVLMDIQMPVLDGIEATKQIRELGGKFTKLPIIAMTAHALTGDSDKSIAAGMNDHITKPIDPLVVYKTLSMWLSSSSTSTLNTLSNSSNNNEAIEILPGIDMQEGLQRMRGKWPSFKRILLNFRANYANTGNAIEQEIAQGKWQEATELAHMLKGISGNISAIGIYKTAAAIEQACKEANEQQARKLLDKLTENMEEVITGLASIDPESNKESKQSIKP